MSEAEITHSPDARCEYTRITETSRQERQAYQPIVEYKYGSREYRMLKKSERCFFFQLVRCGDAVREKVIGVRSTTLARGPPMAVTEPGTLYLAILSQSHHAQPYGALVRTPPAQNTLLVIAGVPRLLTSGNMLLCFTCHADLMPSQEPVLDTG
jgi:hypothetical protein